MLGGLVATLGGLPTRHEHGQKFALEAEVEIETEKKFFQDWD